MGILSVLKMQNGTEITHQVVYGHKWIFYTVWTFSEVSCCQNPNFFQGILLLATHNEKQVFGLDKQYQLNTHTHTHTYKLEMVLVWILIDEILDYITLRTLYLRTISDIW